MRKKIYYCIAVLSAAFMWSCTSDSLWDNQDNEKQLLGIEKQEQLIKEMKSVFYRNAFQLRTVANGECVIGSMQYSASELGFSITKEAIVNYLGNKVQYDSDGNITGISLNTNDWDDLLNHFFTSKRPDSQYSLNETIDNGGIAMCRINYGTHAIVLIGVDYSRRTYTYYDPVLGGEYHTVSWDDIQDPRLLTR